MSQKQAIENKKAELKNKEFVHLSDEQVLKNTEEQFKSKYGKWALSVLNVLTLGSYKYEDDLLSYSYRILIILLMSTLSYLCLQNTEVTFFLILVLSGFQSVLYELFKIKMEDQKFYRNNNIVEKSDLEFIKSVYGEKGLEYCLVVCKNKIRYSDLIDLLDQEDLVAKVERYQKRKQYRESLIKSLS